MVNELKEYFSVIEMADYLGIGRSQAYALVKSDSFPCFKLGGRKIIISKRRLDDWADHQIDMYHL